MLDGRADLAVHSAKDLPAIDARRSGAGGGARTRPTRATRSSAPRSTRLPTGARVATGSVRRRAQLAALRPDLTFAELRGNIDTRLREGIAVRRDRGRRRGASTVSGWATASPSVSTPSGDAPAGRAGRARGRVPRRRRRHAARCWRRSTILRCTPRSAPSARFSPSWAGAVDLPCARVRDGRRRRRLGRRRCSPSLDGSVVVRAHAANADPVKAGIEVAAAAPRRRWTRVARDLVTVYLVGAGPGDPGLLTVRGAALLARADVVVYDRLATPALLELAPRDAELISAGKAPGAVELTQDEINAVLVDQRPRRFHRRAAEGRRPVRVRSRRRGGRGARRGRHPVRGRAGDHERDRRGRRTPASR